MDYLALNDAIKKGELGNLYLFQGEENFTKGLYLAGVECAEDAEAPAGWTKWTIPGYAYLRAEVEDETTFSQVLDYMRANQIPLAGAVHDFTCPANGKQYLFFPIRRL